MRTFPHLIRLIILTLTCTTNFSLYGQIQRLFYIDDFTTLDSAIYEITYEVEKVPDPSKPFEKEVDIQKLRIGKRLSKYYSYLLFQNDSICTIIEKQGDNFPATSRAASTYEVIKNYRTNKISVTDRVYETVFHYEEDTPDLKWQIQSDRKTLMMYSCQKATAEFRGRKYVAWFTSDIPIPEGPFKFGGLPGLIMEMEDTQKHYVYTCIGIKKPKAIEPIMIRNWPYTETTRNKLLEFLARAHKDPTEYYNSRGVTYMVKIDGKHVANPKNYQLPYNPIELE